MTVVRKIRPRGNTAAFYTSANPVLEVRELVIETDTGKAKRGDGTTAWNSLPYINATPADLAAAVATLVTADSTEATARAAADTAEATARASADSTLTTAVTSEASTRAAADTAEIAARNTAITAAIDALIAAAPGTLDTLNELAAALADDPDFAGTITTALAGKQPLDADLTAIAALTTTSYGRALLALADAAAARTALSLGSLATVTPTGTPNGAKFLRDDNAWTALAAGLALGIGNPAALGAVDDGTASVASKEDHVHPTTGLVLTGDPALTDTRTPTDGTVTTAKIVDGNVTLAKIANIATARLLGRNTAGSGVVEELSAATAKTLLAIANTDVSGLGTASTHAHGDYDTAGAAAAAAAASQPVDSDLTAIAALTTTSYGRAFLELANAAAARTAIGTVIGTDVQAYNANTALRTDKLSAFAATTSAELAGNITNETGTGALVFGTSPALTTPTGIVKADVGLGNVDNTADASKTFAATAITSGTVDKARLVIGTDLGYAEITSNQTITTSQADIAGMTTTVIVPSTANGVFVEAFFPEITKNTTGNYLVLYLFEDATQIQQVAHTYYAAAYLDSHTISRARTPSAGSHTYKVQALVQTDTATVLATSGYVPYIRVTAR